METDEWERKLREEGWVPRYNLLGIYEWIYPKTSVVITQELMEQYREKKLLPPPI